MIAFFLTMPISMIRPMIAIIVRSKPKRRRKNNAPTAADGRLEKNRERMDEALVKNAEHNIDGEESPSR